MLFDLRSRGRRTTVRIIYVLLALVMLSGLILVGVGTGNNNGGLLNAFTNNGSGSNQNKAITALTTKALKEVKKSPNSAKAYKDLVQARWTQGNSGSNYNSTTGAYSKSGQQQLKLALTAWNKYVKLTNGKPNIDIAHLAAEAAGRSQQWSAASNAWQYVVADETGASSAEAFSCLSAASYAAGNSRTGDLAAAKAVSAAPKLQKLTLKSTLKSAKKTKTTAQAYVEEEC